MEITGFNKKITVPYFYIAEVKIRSLKELAKIRKFYFSGKKIWRNKTVIKNYF